MNKFKTKSLVFNLPPKSFAICELACELGSEFHKGPVTLLRMRETYEKRMKINAIIFIRTKIL